MCSPQQINGHIGRKSSCHRGIGKTGPLVPESSPKADLIGAPHRTGIVIRGKEHILAELGVLLGHEVHGKNPHNKYEYQSVHCPVNAPQAYFFCVFYTLLN